MQSIIHGIRDSVKKRGLGSRSARRKLIAVLLLVVTVSVIIFAAEGRGRLAEWQYNTHLEAGDFEEALRYGDSLVRLRPGSASAYAKRGAALYQLQEYERSIADFDRAIDLDGEYGPAYLNRGRVRFDAGRHEDALDDFGKAIAPDHYAPHFWRGIARFQLGFHERAISDFDSAIQVVGNRHPPPDELAFSFAYRGLAKYRLAEYDDALLDFGSALEVSDILGDSDLISQVMAILPFAEDQFRPAPASD